MADIFISYSQKDRALAKSLADALKACGYDVWWDYEVVGGVNFRREIRRQLTAARLAIVIWSTNSVDSDWVLDEAGEAKRHDKLVPTRVADFPSSEIPFGFGGLHTEMVTDTDAVLRALARNITPYKVAQRVKAVHAGDTQGPHWNWWSSQKSVDAEVPSVWAIVETILAVLVYWWIAIHFDTYVHLLVGAIMAPLVLLRSDASKNFGLSWFDQWETGFYVKDLPWKTMTAYQRWFTAAFGTLAALASFVMTFSLASGRLVELSGWYAALGGVIVGVVGFAGGGVGAGLGAAVAALRSGAPGGALPVVVAAVGGVAGSIAASMLASSTVQQMAAIAISAAGAGTVTAIVTIAGAGVGPVAGARAGATAVSRGNMILAVLILIPTVLAGAAAIVAVSLTVRMCATLYHLPQGMLSMPRNFRRLALSTPPLQTPELVPGLSDRDSQFGLEAFLKEMNSGDWASRVGLALLLMVYLPAWLYRVSIKSTAWFWWPLAYVGREPHEARDPEFMRRLVSGSPFRRLGRWIAWASIAVFVAINGWDLWQTTSLLNTVHLPTMPPHTLVIGFLLTRLANVPWQITGLASAVIALLVGMWMTHATITLDRATELKDTTALRRAGGQFAWIETLARLGFVCSVLFWLGLAGHLALYANSQRCWFEVPPHVATLAKTLYGDFTPPAPRCMDGAPRR